MALALFAMSVSLTAQNAAPPGSTATIVTVNGEPITQADLDAARSANAGTPVGRVLVDVIDERLVAQRGTNLGYVLSDQHYQRILENVKRQNNITTDERLDAALKESNMTRLQLRANLERTLVVSRVLREDALAQVPFTDEDARRYFDMHLDEFPLQTFELAKPDVIERLNADTSRRNVVLWSHLQPYLLSLRRTATMVWSRPDLQQAYEQAAR